MRSRQLTALMRPWNKHSLRGNSSYTRWKLPSPLLTHNIASSSIRYLSTPALATGLTTAAPQSVPDSDHRAIGAALDLFSTTAYSTGTPLFHPDGAHIFLKLQEFLRAQHAALGFSEVVSPTIYKRALWERSGHWENYREDMFVVKGGEKDKPFDRSDSIVGQSLEQARDQNSTELQEADRENAEEQSEDGEGEEEGEWGLKPMNCPGHCLLFATRPRSWRELPVRFADFGALHRDEPHGSLRGLTRVRRFHQDDGHIFCSPVQVRSEILATLRLVRRVYAALGLNGASTQQRLVLSTRPTSGSIGTDKEWEVATDALRDALDASSAEWTVEEGEGAFYGPKIDLVLRDALGREHQTATIQLDFQLPRRFELEYQPPSPQTRSIDTGGESKEQQQQRQQQQQQQPTQAIRPVLIHRAVLGSLERFIALLLEHHRGRLPFWLSPRQAVLLVLSPEDHVVRKFADGVSAYLSGLTPTSSAETTDAVAGNGEQLLSLARPPVDENGTAPQAPDRLVPLHSPRFRCSVDADAETLGAKIARAKRAHWSLLVTVGPAEARQGTLSVDLRGLGRPAMLKALAWLDSRRHEQEEEDDGLGNGESGGNIGKAKRHNKRERGGAERITVERMRELMVYLSNEYV